METVADLGLGSIRVTALSAVCLHVDHREGFFMMWDALSCAINLVLY